MRRRGHDETVIQRKQDQISVVFYIERYHDVVLVKLHGLFTEIQEPGDLFHDPTLAEQLDDVPLSWRKVL